MSGVWNFRPRRILHVIESFGGGSEAAMRQFVLSTPQFEHHLLRAVRVGEYVEGESLSEFASVADLPSALLGRSRAIRDAVSKKGIDVVHAHSSFAGALVRISILNRGSRSI